MAHLILTRHGTSEYNKAGRWTGISDIDLATEGYKDARAMAEMIRDISVDKVHISTLKRARQTFEEMLKVLEKKDVTVHCHPALNERDYGVHTGKNKWQVKEEVGGREFHNIRRGWDVEIVNGENLKNVYERVVPYFAEHILPQLMQGNNVLVVSHGNTLRALIKHLENISDAEIPDLEFEFGDAHCYEFDRMGRVVGKEIRASSVDRMHV